MCGMKEVPGTETHTKLSTNLFWFYSLTALLALIPDPAGSCFHHKISDKPTAHSLPNTKLQMQLATNWYI